MPSPTNSRSHASDYASHSRRSIRHTRTSGKKICVRRHPVTTHTAPNAKRTGNVNSDAARHGTVHPDADRHGIYLPDGALQSIFLLDALCQGIFLLDAAVSGHFPSGHSRVRAFSFWTQPCQGIFLLDAAMSGHFPTGRVRTTRVMAARSRWLSRHGTSQQILGSHSQTCSRFQA